MKIFNYTLKLVNTNYKVINSYYGQIDLQPQSCKKSIYKQLLFKIILIL